MSKQQNKRIWDWNPKPRSVIIVGILLFLLVVLVHGHAEYQITASLARDTANTLRQQCISFYKLASGDRVKSLFRLSDNLLELSYHLRDDPELINDEYLEQSVDRLRLTGVALLDGDLSLEASGYTRPMQGSPWQNTTEGSLFYGVAGTNKIYAERVQYDGRYYDVCAVPRLDAPGRPPHWILRTARWTDSGCRGGYDHPSQWYLHQSRWHLHHHSRKHHIGRQR